MRIANYEESQRPIRCLADADPRRDGRFKWRDFPGLGIDWFANCDRPARKVASVVLKRNPQSAS